MIIIRGWECARGVTNRGVLKSLINRFNGGIYMKLPNDQTVVKHVFDPNAWREFLETYVDDKGIPLPRRTAAGHPVHWQVYVWGTSGNLKVLSERRGGSTNLFPGTDKNGKGLPLERYGMLRPHPRQIPYQPREGDYHRTPKPGEEQDQ